MTVEKKYWFYVQIEVIIAFLKRLSKSNTIEKLMLMVQQIQILRNCDLFCNACLH